MQRRLMNQNNILAKLIETTSAEGTSLDTVCKKLLSQKNILAWILKTCVEEFQNCSLTEIEQYYIEDSPSINSVAVHQDEQAVSEEFITGIRNESNSILEGTVTYDISFKVINPLVKKKTVRMYIIIESQDDFYPGYPLTKRGVYYGCRMISSQYGTVFSNSHYEKLEKVYSIWICTAPPKYMKNSINLYSLSEKQLYGKASIKKGYYDLITVVMICPGDEKDKQCTGLLRLLSIIFSAKKSAAKKIDILENEFGIIMSQKTKKEVNDMGNYSQHVLKIGLQEGIAQGISQGINQGIFQGTLISLKNLIDSTDMTPEQAMTVLKIPKEEREQYVDKL